MESTRVYAGCTWTPHGLYMIVKSIWDLHRVCELYTDYTWRTHRFYTDVHGFCMDCNVLFMEYMGSAGTVHEIQALHELCLDST